MHILGPISHRGSADEHLLYGNQERLNKRGELLLTILHNKYQYFFFSLQKEGEKCIKKNLQNPKA